MIRRKPTQISLQSEDIAAFDDAREERATRLQQQQQQLYDQQKWAPKDKGREQEYDQRARDVWDRASSQEMFATEHQDVVNGLMSDPFVHSQSHTHQAQEINGHNVSITTATTDEDDGDSFNDAERSYTIEGESIETTNQEDDHDQDDSSDNDAAEMRSSSDAIAAPAMEPSRTVAPKRAQPAVSRHARHLSARSNGTLPAESTRRQPTRPTSAQVREQTRQREREARIRGAR